MDFINNKPIKIKTINRVDEDDEFEGSYTYITNLNKDYSYIRYDNNSCFKSIYHLGELLFLKLIEYGIKDKGNQMYRNKKYINDAYIEFINPWIELNGYLYSPITEHPEFLSIEDSLDLYILFEIHKWLIKINNQKREIIKSKRKIETVAEIDEIIELLKIIEMSDFIKAKLSNHKRYIDGLDEENIMEEYYYLDTIIEKKSSISNLEEMKLFIKNVTQYLIEYTKAKITDRKDFRITKQQPYYDKISDQYRILETAESIIGLAYNQLLLHLTSTTIGYKRGICQAPGCNNEFVKTSNNQKYCQSNTCHSYMIHKKNKKNYIKNTKPRIQAKKEKEKSKKD